MANSHTHLHHHGRPSMVDLDFVTEEVSAYFDEQGIHPGTVQRESMGELLRRSAGAISSISREKKIVLLSALQCTAIAFILWLWGEMLGWAPFDLLKFGSIHDFVATFAVGAWTYACGVLVAYPVAFFTACTGAAHFRTQQGQPSNMAACLAQGLANSPRLWIFYIWDEWQMLSRIGDSVPLRGAINANFPRRLALATATHRAWKAGTTGMPAALSAGNGLLEAAEQSVSLLKSRSTEVLKLRSDYVRLCTILIVGGVIATLVWFLLGAAWIAVPLVAPIAVIALVLRPIYVVASCDLYSHFRQHQRAPAKQEGKPARSERRAAKERRADEIAEHRGAGARVLIAFLVACTVLSAVAVFRDQIGLSQLMASDSAR